MVGETFEIVVAAEQGQTIIGTLFKTLSIAKIGK